MLTQFRHSGWASCRVAREAGRCRVVRSWGSWRGWPPVPRRARQRGGRGCDRGTVSSGCRSSRATVVRLTPARSASFSWDRPCCRRSWRSRWPSSMTIHDRAGGVAAGPAGILAPSCAGVPSCWNRPALEEALAPARAGVREGALTVLPEERASCAERRRGAPAGSVRFAPDAAVEKGRPLGAVLLGPPGADVGQPRLHHVEAVEEPGDLLLRPRHPGRGRVLVDVRGLAGRIGGDLIRGDVGDHHETPGRQLLLDRLHDRPGVLAVLDEVQHGHQEHGHGLIEIEMRPERWQGEQLAGLAQIGVHGGDVDVVGEQRVGVHDHQRVVVAVDDPGVPAGGLGDLVDVALGGQAGADVQELPDPRVAGQVPHRPAQEPAVGPGGHRGIRHRRQQFPRSRPVGGEIILPAQQVVVNPRDIRDADIESLRSDPGCPRGARPVMARFP